MQNVHQSGSILSSDRTYSQTTPTPESADLNSVPHKTGAILVRETPTVAMQPRIDLPGLIKQLHQLTVIGSQQDTVMGDVARLLGNTFQADAGLVLYAATTAGMEVQAAYWLAEFEQIAISPPFIPSYEQAARLDDRSSTVIPDTDALTGALEAKLWVDDLAAVWDTGSIPTSGVPKKSLLGVSAQLPDEFRVRLILLRSQSYSWPNSQVEQLEVAAQQVVSLLSQINLQQQLKRQAEYQRVAKQVVTAVRNSANLGELFQLATSSVATALGVKQAALLRLKYWDPLFRSRTGPQPPQAQVTLNYEWFKQLEGSPLMSVADVPTAAPNQTFWMSECTLCQQAFLRSPQATVIVPSQLCIEGDSVVSPAFPPEELDTFLIAPLESQGTILGFLLLRDQQPRSWQVEEIELVELVSAQLSTAIIQTETLRQVQSLVDKRTAELKQSLTVQAKLYERTRTQLEQLRHLNQLKDEFLDTVSHELRTPLTSMALAIRMLRQTGIEGDRGARYLDILEQQCAQETNLINDLLALQELDSKQTTLQREEVELVTLIQAVTAPFQTRWATKGLVLELSLPASEVNLWSDRESLTRVFVELFTNATRYAEPQTRLRLTISNTQTDSPDSIVITLANEGTAIPPEELPFIFDRFRRCHSAVHNAVPGTGLGLALVKSLVEHLNGTISASSFPTKNSQIWETCFTLTLPQTTGNSIECPE